MILNIIKLGIKLLLKNYCKEIIIRKIHVLTKNNIFKGNIEKLIIEADHIIYKEFYLNHFKIVGSNLDINLNNNSKFLKIKDFYAQAKIHINSENLKNIINKNRTVVNNKVRKFVAQNNYIKKISFDNQSILFYILKGHKIFKCIYILNYNNNNLILKDINSKKYLLIPFDQNIIFKSLSFNKNYLELKFNCKVQLEN